MYAPAFHSFVYAWLAAGLATFLTLLFVPAPYGRLSRPGWGPVLGARCGWMIMELPAAVVPAALYLTSGRMAEPAALVFFVMWEIHYVQRALVYPLLVSSGSTPMPASIVAMSFVFNLINGCLQGGWLYRVNPGYPTEWLRGPRFVLGAALFFVGMGVNWHSDALLRRLRKPGESGYKTPHGGLFRWIACPNYLGEIVEWTGWAVATWSLAGASFAFWTAANLIPRAIWVRRWYRERGRLGEAAGDRSDSYRRL